MLINREHFSLLEKLAGWSEAGQLKPALERTVRSSGRRRRCDR